MSFAVNLRPVSPFKLTLLHSKWTSFVTLLIVASFWHFCLFLVTKENAILKKLKYFNFNLNFRKFLNL